MARPARPWFRFYVETLSDRKLRRLPPAQRWVWAGVLAAARQSPRPGLLLVAEDDTPMNEHDIADIAAVPVKDARQAMSAFERAGMIARNGDAWQVVNWGKRQFESDIRTGEKGEQNDGDSVDGTTPEPTTKPPPNEQRNDNGMTAEPSTELARTGAHARAGARPETETETDIPSKQLARTHATPPPAEAAAANHSRRPSAEERQQRLAQAVDLLTEQELERNPTRGGNVERHRTAVHKGKLRDHHQHGHQLIAANPDITAQALADQLEPPPPPASYQPEPARRHIPDEAETQARLEQQRSYQPPPQELVEGIAAATRQQLEHPHTPEDDT